MPDYYLTERAAEDLFEIACYGIDAFGLDHAMQYRDSLKARFAQLALYPQRYPRVDHIRPGYRRSVVGVHSIYFRQVGSEVEIVRILGRQDVYQNL